MKSIDSSNCSRHIHAFDIHISWGPRKMLMSSPDLGCSIALFFSVLKYMFITLWRRLVHIDMHDCSVLITFLNNIIPGCIRINFNNKLFFYRQWHSMHALESFEQKSPDLLIPSRLALCGWVKHVRQHEALGSNRWHCCRQKHDKKALRLTPSRTDSYLLALLAAQC